MPLLAAPITELGTKGFCVLRSHLPKPLIDACRDAFLPTLTGHLKTYGEEPNRGPHRHFLPMPFQPPCFAPRFFFDPTVLEIARSVLGSRVVADQWGCDVPLRGSEYQEAHADYKRPLFQEAPDMQLPPYILVMSFGLIHIGAAHGPIEIAPGTHRMPRAEAFHAVATGETVMEPVLLELGDVLIRHPWAIHRGTPNTTHTPRALASIRYVRSWYRDASREVHSVPKAVWDSLSPDQQEMMGFPVQDY